MIANILQKLKNLGQSLKDKILKLFSLFRVRFFIVFSFVLVVFITGFLLAEKVFIPGIVYVPYTTIHLTGVQVNEYIKEDLDYYIHEYAIHENISIRQAKIVITKAIKYEVPINFAFAVAFNESGYKENIKSKPNLNGSFDYGFMQLNNFSFPDVEGLLPLDKNVDTGLRYLRACYDNQKSWDLSYIEYNAGAVKNFDRTNKRHIKNIYEKARAMDEWISSVVRDKIVENFSESEILTQRE